MGGLDLGFPGGQTHARASLFEQRALGQGSRLAPAATRLAAGLFGAATQLVPSNSGGLVASDQRMALYAWWFEARLARPDAPRTLSLAPRGRAIPGLPLGSLEELLALAPRRSEIDGALERLCGAGGNGTPLAETLSGLLEGLDRVAEIAGRGARLARAAEEEGGEGPAPALLSSLEMIDGELRSSGLGDIVGFLLPPLGSLLGAEAEPATSLRTTARLYAFIEDSARSQHALLSDSLGEGPAGDTSRTK
jgi:hypothetical protein